MKKSSSLFSLQIFFISLKLYHQFALSVLSFRNFVVQVSCHNTFAFPSAGDLFFLFHFICYFRDDFGGKIKLRDKSATLKQNISFGLFTYEKIKVQRMKGKKKYKQKLASSFHLVHAELGFKSPCLVSKYPVDRHTTYPCSVAK